MTSKSLHDEWFTTKTRPEKIHPEKNAQKRSTQDPNEHPASAPEAWQSLAQVAIGLNLDLAWIANNGGFNFDCNTLMTSTLKWPGFRGGLIYQFLCFQFNNILNDQYLACSSSFGVLMIAQAIWNFPKNVSMVRPKSGLISQRYYYYRLPHRSKHCYLPPTTRILGRVQE